MIRLMTTEEFDLFYAIRLAALETNPEAFLTRADEFSARPRDQLKKRYLQNTGQPDQFIAAAFDGGQIVGMAGFRRYDKESRQNRGQVWGVFITPEARGRGLGQKLMGFVLEEACRMPGLRFLELSVKKDNGAAIQLYEKIGFRPWTPASDDPIWGTACATEVHMIYDREEGHGS